MTKVLIIGMDGATFDLIKPWAAEGKLPNLRGLLGQASHGPLASTVPPMTFPSWATFMTGKNPGKHGIFDFTERISGSFDLQLVNSRHRRCQTIWKMLSEAGKRVGVVGVPVCYPPEAINGVMISGFDTPVAVADEKVMYPPELCEELKNRIGGYIISADIVPLISKGRIEEATVALEKVIERKAATAKYLLRREPWDCFMVMFGETDASVHYFWRYHDPSSPHYDPKRCRGVRDPILAVYQKMDQMVGELLALVGEETTIMLVSDHGTGGSSDQVIHLNRWLEEEGLFQYLSTSQRGMRARLNTLVYGRLLHLGKSWLRSFLPKWIINRMRFGDKKLAYKLESKLRFSSIDWSRSKAFSEETPYFPQIWINLKGREPHGIVQPGAEYEEVRDTIIERLSSWRDPATGEKVVNRVYRREEVYQGDYVHKAPDLLISWNLTGGNAYLFRPSLASKKKLPIEKVGRKELWSSSFMINHSGCHREVGVFALRGKGIKSPSWIEGAQMSDLAPTILYLLGVPIPSDMDGKVLNQIFRDEHLVSHPVYYGSNGNGSGLDANLSEPEQLFASDEEAIAARLQGLGYIE